MPRLATMFVALALTASIFAAAAPARAVAPITDEARK
jgi:hypothetical protein